MGRSKYELKKVHRKKVRKAKEKLKLYSKGEIPCEKLPSFAKHFLQKSKKQKQTSA
jgi:hypothetical protein